MARQIRTQVLRLLTTHALLCLYASFGENINCWWNKVQTVDHNVYIECQAVPPISTQKCPCDLQLTQPVQAMRHHCTQVSAHFTAAVELQDMQHASCILTCRGQDPRICTITEGYPPPTCSVTLEDEEQNMNCSWSHNLLNPMNFSLHLQDMHGNWVSGSPLDLRANNSVIIQRDKYEISSHLRAWLSASNALGSVRSHEVIFNTATIVQPSPPHISAHSFEPLEILWESETYAGLPAQRLCKVQYRKLCDPEWTEDEANHETNFILRDAVPDSTYTFRVRCSMTALEESSFVVLSDWSKEYNAAPCGKLDVWIDCEPSSEAPTCRILWKELPMAQAQDNISYMVRMRLRNSSDISQNVESAGYTAEETCMRCPKVMDGNRVADVTSRDPPACDREQRCFQYICLEVPITEVTGVYVAADTAQGETSPSFVALPRTDNSMPMVKLAVRGASRELSVSWSVPARFSDGVQEYVVQHKPLDQPHFLNWVRVHKSQDSTVVRGPLRNYTAYNVSLFAVVNNYSQLLGSDIAYTVQRVPPKVEALQIIGFSSSSVDLTWTPIPLKESPGLILHYLVGLDDFSVVNVTRNMSSVRLRELKPAHHYVVWISAVSEAGEGEKATARFTTKASENFIFVVVIVTLTVVFICFIGLIVWCYSSPELSRWHHRIPDPINSSLFNRENIEVQFHYSWPDVSTLTEHSLIVSNMELVTVSDSPSATGDDSIQRLELAEVEQQPARPEEEPERRVGGSPEQQESRAERTSSTVLHRRKDYIQVVDSNDEQGSGEDEEWDEQPQPSDYERHFLPCM